VALNQDRVAHVGTPLAGRVTTLQGRVGDRVAAGDVLMVVDSPELGQAQSDYLKARIDAASAEPAVALARSAWERGKALQEQGRLSLTEAQQREAEFRAAEATLAVAQGALAATESRLKLLGLTDEVIATLAKGEPINPRFEIRAPIGGEVVAGDVTLGEQVGPDDHELFVIADLTTVWVLADVPETRLGEIGSGSAAVVRVAALGDRAIRGRVSHVAPSLDPATRTGTARIEIHDPPAALRPGVFARVSIETGGKGGTSLAVPDAAVQTVEGEPSVFVPVAGEPNTYARRPVKLGRRVGEFVAVESGLREGEPVVVSGSFILKAELGKSEAGHDH
jgi:cobalt-zinc-cadmium efflux system membrane fusion protein